jgi:hypothetical protein
MKFKTITSLLLCLVSKSIFSTSSSTSNKKTKQNFQSYSHSTSSSKSSSTTSSQSKTNPKKPKLLGHTQIDLHHRDAPDNIKKLPTLAERNIAEAYLKSHQRNKVK